MRRSALAALLVALALSAAAAFGTGDAAAKAEARSDYTKSQTYSGALRYLRVDLGYEVTERDPDAAYLLFRYVPNGKKTPTNGSIEIVEHKGNVRVLVQLPQMPAYHEQAMRDGLLQKLTREYGAPAEKKPAERAPAPEAPKDGGAG